MSGEGSRAFLGLQLTEDSRPRPVALIWVPDETARDAALHARISGETARASFLEHPNIMRVFGLASLDEGLARVVEFANGEPLRRILEKTGTLPPSFAALVVADAA